MPYQPFAGLEAPQGLQMEWQPNIGGENDSQQAMAGLGSASDMLRQWLASRRKGVGAAGAGAAGAMNPMSDLPAQSPQNQA